ncbi:MAG TPA: CsgG/HfaB family protein [Spirochaetota bacterium]|nr:CsgG/HfaB family protein [Spirochaetota bacterium]
MYKHAVLLWALLVAAALNIQAGAAEEMRIAVLKLPCGKEVSEGLSKDINELLTTAMINLGLFVVVERSSMKKVLAEQGLQASGLLDPDSTVKVGKLLSANKILTGKISRFGSITTISVRVVDVEKGVAEFAESIAFKEKDEVPDKIKKLAERLGGRISGKIKPVFSNIRKFKQGGARVKISAIPAQADIYVIEKKAVYDWLRGLGINGNQLQLRVMRTLIFNLEGFSEWAGAKLTTPVEIEAEARDYFVFALGNNMKFIKEVTLRKGENPEIAFDLRWSRVKVTSKPEDAKIYVDGQLTSVTTPAVLDVIPGSNRRISIYKENFSTKKKHCFFPVIKTNLLPEKSYQIDFPPLKPHFFNKGMTLSFDMLLPLGKKYSDLFTASYGARLDNYFRFFMHNLNLKTGAAYQRAAVSDKSIAENNLDIRDATLTAFTLDLGLIYFFNFHQRLIPYAGVSGVYQFYYEQADVYHSKYSHYMLESNFYHGFGIRVDCGLRVMFNHGTGLQFEGSYSYIAAGKTKAQMGGISIHPGFYFCLW